MKEKDLISEATVLHLYILVHFFAVFGKTTKWNDQIQDVRENLNVRGEFSFNCLALTSQRIQLQNSSAPADQMQELKKARKSSKLFF